MIHQFVPMLHSGDAVGAHTVALHDLLVARGIPSRIYVEIDDSTTADRTTPFARYEETATSDDLLVYQFATASRMADELASLPQRLVVNYHNVTPPDCFVPWDDALAHHQLWARNQLGMLAGRARLAVAVSEANRADLLGAGFRATAMVPPVVRLAGGPAPHRPPRLRGACWLAVGRIAPNKALEATVAALFVYRERYDRDAELVVVGRPAVPSYARAVRRYAADLGLADAVHFTGGVDDGALRAAYTHADVLVVSSVHEGFCLPAAEAMAHGVPVVAYRQGALPEVLGDGGVLLDTADPGALAEAVRALQTDVGRREHLVEAARRHLETLDLAHSGERMVDLMLAVHDGTAWPAGVRPVPEDAATVSAGRPSG